MQHIKQCLFNLSNVMFKGKFRVFIGNIALRGASRSHPSRSAQAITATSALIARAAAPIISLQFVLIKNQPHDSV